MQSIFIKKCFLFTVGSVCRIKRLTTEWRNCHLVGECFTDDEEVETEVRKLLRQQSKRFLCCGFRRTGKAMGEVYQCWWRRICGEINAFSRFKYHMFYVYIHLWPVY
jgi:hypothetical protein